MFNKSIEYLLSLHILKQLRDKDLITDKELTAIDELNKESLKPIEKTAFDLK